ncbi:MAG: prepilin-type N-terminal cleavage/methylation domain-containing protein [Gemmataceae bacterium]
MSKNTIMMSGSDNSSYGVNRLKDSFDSRADATNTTPQENSTQHTKAVFASSPCDRHGYTLIEVLIALAISGLVLYALYFAFFTLYNQTEAGRDQTRQASVARSLFQRLRQDIRSHLPPLDPRLVDLPEGLLPEAELEELEGLEGLEEEPPPEDVPIDGGVESTVLFNSGVWGEPDRVALYVTLAGNPRKREKELEEFGRLRPDVRRVCYWMIQGNNGPLGLARMESPLPTEQVTLEDFPWNTLSIDEQRKYLLAPEVRSIQFEYYDGLDWQIEWDGTQPALEAPVPVGPPTAIRISLRLGDRKTAPEDEDRLQQFQHIVAIPTANGNNLDDLGDLGLGLLESE